MSTFSPPSSLTIFLDAHAAHADAGANGINAFLAGSDSDLGARTCLTGDGLDLHGPGMDLGYFQLKQPPQQRTVGTGEDQVGAARAALHLGEVGVQALADLVLFARYLLRRRHFPFSAAQVKEDGPLFHARHHATHKLTLEVSEALVGMRLLGLADLLLHNLLEGQGGNAAPALRQRQRNLYLVVLMRLRERAPRRRQGNLAPFVAHAQHRLPNRV